MSLPSNVALPAEMNLGHLDNSLPPDAKSFSVKIQPSNLSSVTSSFTPPVTATSYFGDQIGTSSNIIFDIPCGSSPSLFLDNRVSTISFQATFDFTGVGGTAGTLFDSYLRSGAYSFFDRMYITSQNGSIVEDISEYGVVNDTLIALQMNNAVRHGVANQYGFDVNSSVLGSQGHKINVFSSGNTAPATSQSETHSYSIPLVSGVLGVLADKMINLGRTSKLQVVLQTSNILPITGGINSAWTTTAPTFRVTLSNFSLQMEYIDIGVSALQLLDESLVDGKAYIHGTTYRTSSATLPASTSGSTSLLAGIRASSVKSLFARFAQTGTAATATVSLHGKYNSFNPMINSLNFNIGGLKYPQTPIPVLLSPSQSFRETQIACGSYNNSNFQSCVPPSAYCRLSTGGTAQSLTVGATQEYSWNTAADTVNQQSQFIFGENCETVMRRGLLSGLNCTSSPIFLEMNIAAATTYSHNVFIMGMLDHVVIHDCRSGDIQVRI